MRARVRMRERKRECSATSAAPRWKTARASARHAARPRSPRRLVPRCSRPNRRANPGPRLSLKRLLSPSRTRPRRLMSRLLCHRPGMLKRNPSLQPRSMQRVASGRPLPTSRRSRACSRASARSPFCRRLSRWSRSLPWSSPLSAGFSARSACSSRSVSPSADRVMPSSGVAILPVARALTFTSRFCARRRSRSVCSGPPCRSCSRWSPGCRQRSSTSSPTAVSTGSFSRM